ncbi:MAG: TIGR00153 family protein [Deltaproteobacteria bacterium]|jgi:predicted phosphate transport protein (TIGR00153 family)
MFLKKILSYGKKEDQVIKNVKEHLRLLCLAFESFYSGIKNDDTSKMREVIDLEREGDSVRREIISTIYAGAFLPYLRPDLCRFVEALDRVLDSLEDTAFNYSDVALPEEIKEECVRVASMNTNMCEMLAISFDAMVKGEDLREKALAIRIYEKRIDDIKFSVLKEMRTIPVENFWQGRTLAEFVSDLTTISDMIEDASDYLQIINISMR